MKDEADKYKSHQELCFMSEKIFVEKFNKLIDEFKAENLDVGTIITLLIKQSLGLVFQYTHSADDAIYLVNSSLNDLIEKHLSTDSESLDSINYEDNEPRH